MVKYKLWCQVAALVATSVRESSEGVHGEAYRGGWMGRLVEADEVWPAYLTKETGVLNHVRGVI